MIDSENAQSDTTVFLGIGLKIAAVCIFVSMSTMLKAAEGIPAGQLVFFRSAFAIIPVLIMLAVRGELKQGFMTKRPLGHLWRGLIGITSMSLGFYGLTQLPLPESIAISYATPLLIVVLSAIILKEQVRLYRWAAVIVGLIGVLVILWPRLSILSGGTAVGGQSIGALAALGAAFFAAAAMLQVRNLVQTEMTATIVLYFFIAGSSLSLLSLPFGWVMPNPQQLSLLIGAGLAGGVAQILVTQCYRYADMSVIAPFDYTSMLLGLAVGYILFAETPTLPMLAGAILVVGAGIFIILREHQLGLKRRRANAAATPQT
ncbi:DMT family transporter [Devosia rhodophyticola]|uniref:DMT family transporter n=1 Tax=Devosia rhodophyticola TaxID=3026423 RepID=A0ABY7YYI7_9HYPH|nr:DMT family transporter [Devosia rhodophyticola]WDR06458.1 DMT family transporter [Devosia rhodophyticola]